MTKTILIVGCGIAGPTLASFLLLSRGEQFQITLLERAHSLRAQGQNIDIRGAGVTVLRKLGLESAVRSFTSGEEGVLHVDAQDRAYGRLPADKTGKVQTATSNIEILRGKLAEIFFIRSQSLSDRSRDNSEQGVEYIFGDQPTSIDQNGDGVIVKLAKNGQRKFDIVVGADGLQSSVRDLAFKSKDVDFHKTGMYSGFFSMPRIESDGNWRKWFHAVGSRGVMIRPSHSPNRMTVTIGVCNETDRRLDEVASRDHGVKQQKDLLAEYLQGTGWKTDRVIKEMYTADDFYYNAVAQVRMNHWFRGRVVLLGDAGYCASPLSGMGTTLALTGAYNLAGSLSRNDNIDAAFAEYEASMRPIVHKAQKLAPGMPWILHPRTWLQLQALKLFLFFISYSGLITILSILFGPPAKSTPVDRYEFEEIPDGWGLEMLQERLHGIT